MGSHTGICIRITVSFCFVRVCEETYIYVSSNSFCIERTWCPLTRCHLWPRSAHTVIALHSSYLPCKLRLSDIWSFWDSLGVWESSFQPVVHLPCAPMRHLISSCTHTWIFHWVMSPSSSCSACILGTFTACNYSLLSHSSSRLALLH